MKLELEGESGRASLEALLVKQNIEGPRPYFEFRGGDLTGWLSIQLPSDKNATFRFEFAPHLGSPSDALSTHRFLTMLGEAGVLHLIDPQTGNKLARITKARSSAKVVLPNIRRFLRDLDSINRALGLRLCVPPPPAELPRDVALIAAGLKHGRVAVTPHSSLVICMPARVARGLLSREQQTFAATGGSWRVLGTDVDLGPSRVLLVDSSAHDPSALQLALEGKADDEPVQVELICDRVVHEFERWGRP